MTTEQVGGTPGAQDAFAAGENEPTLDQAMEVLTNPDATADPAPDGGSAPSDQQAPSTEQAPEEPASVTPDPSAPPPPPEVLVDYLGERVTPAELELRAKAAEEWQATGTRRNQESIERERQAQASQAELDGYRTGELERELATIELPARPVRPIEPKEIEFKDLETGTVDEAGFRDAVIAFRKKAETYNTEESTYDQRYKDATDARTAKQAEIDGRRTTAQQHDTEATEAEQKEVKEITDTMWARYQITQPEVNQAWERTHEIAASRPAGRYNLADIYRAVIADEILPARSVALKGADGQAATDLNTEQAAAAADPANGVPPEPAASANQPRRLSDLPPGSDEANQYIDEGIARDAKTGSNETLMEVLEASGAVLPG